MPVQWTATVNGRLLVAILAVHEIRPNCDALAARVPGATPKAVSLQLAKLKKLAADADAGGGGDGDADAGAAAKGDGGAPATPRKRAAGAKEGAVLTPKKGARGGLGELDDDDEGDELVGVGRKRVAAGGARKEGGKVKVEVGEELGYDDGAVEEEEEEQVFKKVKTKYGDEHDTEVERGMELDGFVES